MQRYTMRGDGSMAQVHKSSIVSFPVPIVRRLALRVRASSDESGVVDRDEVDRLRKRFMKLDKVGQDSLPEMKSAYSPLSSNTGQQRHYRTGRVPLTTPSGLKPFSHPVPLSYCRTLSWYRCPLPPATVTDDPLSFLKHDRYLRRRRRW